ncbi:alpha-L-rhamnosidase C-terminal domain-containing protein [Propionibacterium cyclohexanicum]|uniref:alpha-L-rhamnosidase C-terminal domain-containing protein n=1 Tax=Propionibacterium cyclohexanicum TaxID=64702 RepID=UPI0015A71552
MSSSRALPLSWERTRTPRAARSSRAGSASRTARFSPIGTGISRRSSRRARFRVAPRPGGGLSWAVGDVRTPYGRIAVRWCIRDDAFAVHAEVPVSTRCTVTMPDGSSRELTSGSHDLSCEYRALVPA